MANCLTIFFIQCAVAGAAAAPLPDGGRTPNAFEQRDATGATGGLYSLESWKRCEERYKLRRFSTLDDYGKQRLIAACAKAEDRRQ